MKALPLLTINVIIIAFVSSVQSQFQTERPFAPPYQVNMGRRKHIDALTPRDRAHRGGQTVGLDAQSRDRVVANLPNARTAMLAGAKGDAANAVLGQRSRASARRIPGRGGISGGTADAGNHRGFMVNNRDGQGSNNANFTLDGRYKLNTQGEGRGGTERFWANGTRKSFGIDPVSQDRRKGEGVLQVGDKSRGNEEFFLYEIQDQGGGRTEAVIGEPDNNQGQPQGALSNLFRQRAKKYRCQAMKVGESLCKDQNGRTVGKVNVNDKGEAIVFNNFGLPIYRSQVKRTGRDSYVTVVNNGLMSADVKHMEERDCVRDLGGTPGKYKIQLRQPLRFTYQTSRTRNGETAIRWPDCFDIGGTLVLGPGVDPERMAFEWIVNLRPVGRLRCVDPGTCKKDCYYCNGCSNSKHKLDILDNSESNLCTAEGGNQYNIKVKICPPPQVFNWAMCSKFTKFATDDYWKKQGDLDVQLRIWMRPLNEQAKAKEFHDIMNGPLASVRRLGFIPQYTKDEGLQAGLSTPTDAELKEWFIHQNNPDEIAVCRRAVMKWGIGGQKVDTSFLLEAAGAAASFPDLISRTKCPKWDQMQQQQYQADAQELSSSGQGGGGGGVGGLFGNIFGGGNRNGGGGIRSLFPGK